MEDTSKLLFYDSFKYDKPQYNIEEIFFLKPVYLHQIRILKADSIPHSKLHLTQSITQSTPIFHFEVFAKNLVEISDQFEQVITPTTVDPEDTIFPFYKKLITNHLIIRGSFEKITICVYGQPCSNQENIFLLESQRNDINLDNLK